MTCDNVTVRKGQSTRHCRDSRKGHDPHVAGRDSCMCVVFLLVVRQGQCLNMTFLPSSPTLVSMYRGQSKYLFKVMNLVQPRALHLHDDKRRFMLSCNTFSVSFFIFMPFLRSERHQGCIWHQKQFFLYSFFALLLK